MAGKWVESTIGEQIELQRGFDITRSEQKHGDIPVISSGGQSSFHDTAAMNGPGVVLGRKGVVGSVFYIDKPFCPHDTTLFVKDFKGNNPRFVYYFFKSISDELRALDVGSANPTLNRNHVHPRRVRWPGPQIQSRITNLLGALDDKIELNRRMAQALETMPRAMFKSWFVDFEPVRAKGESRDMGLAGDLSEMFPNSFGEDGLPVGWSFGPLLHQANLISGGTPKTGETAYWNGMIPWASAADVSQCQDAFLIETERTISARGLRESAT